MREREEKIVEAAVGVFSRYGVKRTTMNDIAREAGVVRQTLYNVYASKDDVLRATIRWYADRSLAATEAECADAATLGDKLDIAFKHLIVAPYELIHATPHAADILSGLSEAAAEEMAIADERYRAAIEALLVPHEKRLRSVGLNPQRLSDLVEAAWNGFKYKAKSKKHLMELHASLKVLVLMAAGAA